MSESTIIIPAPLALLTAPLPHWVKLVWLSIRSFQGLNKNAWPSLETIGTRVVNDKGNFMDKGQVSRGIKILVDSGFLMVENRKYLTCLIPPNVDEGSTLDHNNLPVTLITHQRGVDEGSTVVDHPSTVVDEGSTPTEKKQLISTIKKNKKRKVSRASLPDCLESYEQVRQHWNEFASTLDLPLVRRLTDKRKSWIRKRGAEIWPEIESIYSEIKCSHWLVKNFRVSFDFIWKNEDNYNKILEGKYRNKNGKASKQGTGNSSHTPVSAYERIHSIARATLDPGQGPLASTGTGG